MVMHNIHAEGMTLSETFQVAAFIEKMPPSEGISKIISNTRERSCHLKT